MIARFYELIPWANGGAALWYSMRDVTPLWFWE
jgi:hypothetical protein